MGSMGGQEPAKKCCIKTGEFFLRFFVWKFCEELKNPGAIQDTKEPRFSSFHIKQQEKKDLRFEKESV